MKPQAILFDLDGTLLDTTEDIAAATNRSLERFGYAPKEIGFFPLAVGDGARMLIRRCLEGEAHPQSAEADLLTAFLEDYSRNLMVHTRPYAGIPELLDELRARDIRLAVLSNKPDAMTKYLVRELLGDDRFEIAAGATPEFPKKPDPVAALDIAQRMGLTPDQFLYVGDTGTDMQTAVGAGMRAVGVLWGYRGRDELEQNGATCLIARPGELCSYV